MPGTRRSTRSRAKKGDGDDDVVVVKETQAPEKEVVVKEEPIEQATRELAQSVALAVVDDGDDEEPDLGQPPAGFELLDSSRVDELEQRLADTESLMEQTAENLAVTASELEKAQKACESKDAQLERCQNEKAQVEAEVKTLRRRLSKMDPEQPLVVHLLSNVPRNSLFVLGMTDEQAMQLVRDKAPVSVTQMNDDLYCLVPKNGVLQSILTIGKQLAGDRGIVTARIV